MFSEFKLIAFLASVVMALDFKYDIEIRSDNIVDPCPEYPNNYYDKFLTRPENITIMPDGTVYIAGDILLIYDFDPSIKGKLDLEFYKRDRGSWKRTIYTVKRNNLCESMFDQKEIWAPLSKNIPAEQRKCPFEKGRLVAIDYQTEQGFFLPSAYLEGEYWVRAIFGEMDNKNTFCCVDMYFTLYRS